MAVGYHIPTSLACSKGREFVADCTRAAEGLLSDQELQEKYELRVAQHHHQQITDSRHSSRTDETRAQRHRHTRGRSPAFRQGPIVAERSTRLTPRGLPGSPKAAAATETGKEFGIAAFVPA